MKKMIASLVLILVNYVVGAQVTMTDTVVFKSFPKDNHEHLLRDTIINNTPNTITITWNKLSEQLLSGWNGGHINDPYASYPYNSGSSQSFTLAPGASGEMSVAMIAIPTASDGTCYVTLTTNYGDMVFKFETASQAPAFVNDQALDNNMIYPNPAGDFICIKGENKILYKVNIWSMNGNIIYSTTARMNEVFNISSLSNGFYLLNTIDPFGRSQYFKLVKQ